LITFRRGIEIVTVNQALDLIANTLDASDNFAVGELGAQGNFVGRVGINTQSPTYTLQIVADGTDHRC